MIQEPLSVLLVDDEPSFVHLLSLQLRQEYGFQTTVALTGKEATQLIESTRRGFDVILLDYFMPDVNGLNVLQSMFEQKNETPVIMLTGAGSEGIAVEAMKLGAYDYLRKEEIDVPHLVNVILGVHERHLFRIAKRFEAERAKEMGLNREATEKMRDVISAITPALNDSMAKIETQIETVLGRLLSKLPPEHREEIHSALVDLQVQLSTLEGGIRGLLSLYYIVHARYSEVNALEHIRQQFDPSGFRKEGVQGDETADVPRKNSE